MADEPARQPAREAAVKDAAPDLARVALTGVLTELDPGQGRAVLQDETGSMPLHAEDPALLRGLQNGETVRAIGRPRSGRLSLESLHKLKDFDAGLWKRVRAAERAAYRAGASHSHD